jgi:hypothetical protein
VFCFVFLSFISLSSSEEKKIGGGTIIFNFSYVCNTVQYIKYSLRIHEVTTYALYFRFRRHRLCLILRNTHFVNTRVNECL